MISASMLTIWALGLTAAGTILAISPPTLGAPWADEETPQKEKLRRIPYYLGISMIVLGTAIQMIVGWPK